MKAFSYKMAANGDLELNITGVIGDGWSEDPVTAEAIRKVLKDNPKTQNIKANIDSSGGSFFEGLAIYQMLQEHPANVEVSIGARAASAASLIAMAGDSISIHETSTMLIHPVWTIAMGNAEEMRKVANDLDTLSGASVKAYAARTGMTEEATTALLNEDRYMTADEALKMGFCTVVRKAKGKGEPTKALSEKELRSEVEQMRTSAQASLGTLRMAASAPSVQPDPPSGGSNSPQQETKPHVGEEQSKMDPKLILAALGLPEGATLDQVNAYAVEAKAAKENLGKLVTVIGAKSADEATGLVGALLANRDNVDGEGHSKILASLGVKSSAEALGVIGALQGAKGRAEQAEAELAQLKSKRELSEREQLIAQLRADGKCTPAQEETLFPNLNMEGLKAFAATAVPVLKGDGRRQARAGGQKSYNEMSNKEREELHASDPALFNQLRDEAEKAGTL